MQSRRISYEKARLIARYADENAIREWIDRAEHLPCIALRRELQQGEEMRMCARGQFEVWAPPRISAVIAEAFSAARQAAGRWISAGEILAENTLDFLG